MFEEGLAITVYFDEESTALLDLISELDELQVDYEEYRLIDVPVRVLSSLYAGVGQDLKFPIVTVHDQILMRPTTAAVMTAIGSARRRSALSRSA